MYADKNVDAIFCVGGGYGTPRILPYLDFDLIRRNPKVLLGYSDIIALLTSIHSQTGLVSFHGPIARQNFSDYTLAEFKKVLMQPEAGIAIGKFSDAESSDGNSFGVEQVIEQRCVPLDVPTIKGLMIGHIEDQTVVPLGVRAELDADAGSLTLLEPAVI